MSAENNLKTWEAIYDKYAPAMYGIICMFTDHKATAKQIFTGAFLELTKTQVLSKTGAALCIFILKHTYCYTGEQLKLRAIPLNKHHSPDEVKLIDLLCTRCNSLKEIASVLNITEAETKIKLDLEILELRNKPF